MPYRFHHRQRFAHGFILWAALAVFILLGLSLVPSAQAWTPGLKEAAEAVALGGASAQQRMLVFVINQ